MRSSPLPALTLRTPALPGFRVSGDAKTTGFESFGASPGYHSNRAKGGISDLSTILADELVSATAREVSPFERVQMDASVERQLGAGVLGSSLLRRPFERARGQVADAIRSRSLRQSFEPRLRTGEVSLPTLRRPFERVQMASRPSPLPEDGSVQPSKLSIFESAQGVDRPLMLAENASAQRVALHAFERVQTPPAASTSLASHPGGVLFERVQMACAGGHFLIPSGQPRSGPRPSAAQAPGLRPTPTTQEEIRMPPPQ